MYAEMSSNYRRDGDTGFGEPSASNALLGRNDGTDPPSRFDSITEKVWDFDQSGAGRATKGI